MSELPSIRWGIIATGMISSWFVADLILERRDAKARHVIQAIGSSDTEKGKKFAAQFCPQSSPAVYGSYEEAYADPNVDIVYIGTPHAFHKQNCLAAIAAGKAVLCEKAFTLNAQDAKEVFQAAKEKGVYVAEAMWLRHRPLVQDIQKMIHTDRVIGNVLRVYSDFGLEKDIPNLPEGSRYRQPSLGAGSLLDLGLYSVTWALLSFDPACMEASEPVQPVVQAMQSHSHGVEVSTAVLLQHPLTGQHGIVTSTTMTTGNPDMVARIQGTKGSIEVHGECPSAPVSFTVYTKFTRDMENEAISRDIVETFNYPVEGRGYYFEADNAALDVLAGRLESAIMPWSETVRVLGIMDEIRRQGGTVYDDDPK
ncbi:dimeric dihydrodiol dehydrogenase [Dactylonectria macrodidyma]|uniref:D-xylose 1-dehydrogenase (NADP(+), D-xylono-1,5-lactone-forming) n=1 Tax=Dactylonectria macrodidyma TaxID=307937 RepID=A0A9P9FV26_9HYPO|nr:dimeric dihydrodiol dehydrogenase [Dactylonectria macrodidyma]